MLQESVAAHTLRIRYALESVSGCKTHTPRIRYAYATHTLRIRYAYSHAEMVQERASGCEMAAVSAGDLPDTVVQVRRR